MEKIIHIDAVGKTLERLNAGHEAGEIQGIVTAVQYSDGHFEISWSNTLKFTERIGLAETLKYDMLLRASCPHQQ